MDFKTLEPYWFVLCESRDLKKAPKAMQILGKDVAVFRGQDGQVVAFIDRCPHRNVRVSEGRVCNGHLVCPFHGWEFDQDGTCVHIPGMVDREELRAPGIKRYETLEAEGLVWIRLNSTDQPDRRPHLPAHLTDPALKTVTHRTHLNASSLNIAENFLDPFHTPFVHAGIIRTATKRSLNKIFPAHLEEGLEVVYLKEQQQSGFISLFGRQVHKDVGRFLLPGIIELEYHAKDGLEFINTMYITPRSEHASSIYFKASLRPYLLPTSLVYGIAGFAIKVALKQDHVILEEQTRAIHQHGGTAYANTELDIVRRQLEYLYAGNGRRVAFKELEALI